MLRRLGLGKNNHLTYASLALNPRNINGIRGKLLELLAFLDAHQAHVMAISETKINSTTTTSDLFQETCMYSVYRKYRNTHGGGVMLLIH